MSGTSREILRGRCLRRTWRTFEPSSADGYMSEVVPPLFVGHDLSAGVDYLLTHGVQKFREKHDQIVFIGE